MGGAAATDSGAGHSFSWGRHWSTRRQGASPDGKLQTLFGVCFGKVGRGTSVAPCRHFSPIAVLALCRAVEGVYLYIGWGGVQHGNNILYMSEFFQGCPCHSHHESLLSSCSAVFLGLAVVPTLEPPVVGVRLHGAEYADEADEGDLHVLADAEPLEAEGGHLRVCVLLAAVGDVC